MKREMEGFKEEKTNKPIYNNPIWKEFEIYLQYSVDVVELK